MYQKHKLQNIKNYTFVTFYFPVTTGVILTISFYIANTGNYSLHTRNIYT